MDGVEAVAKSIFYNQIQAEIWVDGSFLTKKIDPDDADMVLFIDHQYYLELEPARRALFDEFDNGSVALKAEIGTEVYAVRTYPPGHQLHGETEWERAYWTKQYGFSRDLDWKGIAVIRGS